MGTIIGRDEELKRIARFLDQAKVQRVARVLRITGASGNGKTALAGAARDAAQAEGWIAPLVAAHRIQATLPLIAARRLAEETIRTLGDEASRYTSGLESALRETADTAAFESAFFRLVEAVLLDRPLAFAIDDAQWADRESGALLLRTVQFYADRPLVLMLVDRSDEDTEPAFEYIDETIVVREFTASAAERLARTLMPSASDDVIRAVVHHARGRAIDITTIASLSDDHAHLTSEEVAASARSIVAATIGRLKPATREFLQICALIGDPIELPILGAIWPQDELLSHIRECSGTYLVQDSAGLRFVHLTVMQSIRETLPIDIPYRKRIIAAIESLPQLNVERLERLTEQAAACGERDLELRYLHRIVNEAESASLFDLVGSALRRIIALSPFDESALRYYERLSIVQNIVASHGTAAICREALSRASQAGYDKGLGQIAASLLFSLWHNEDRSEFWTTLDFYDRTLREAADRGHIIGVKMYAALAGHDQALFDDCSRELATINTPHPMFELRAHIFGGQLAARSGDIAAWRERRKAASDVLERHRLSNVFGVMGYASDALFYLHTYGTIGTELERALSHLPASETLRDNIETIRLLASGSMKDTLERILEQFERKIGTFSKRVSLGIAGAALTLSEAEAPSSLLRALEREADGAIRGNKNPVLLPVLSAAATLTSDLDRASHYIDIAAELSSQPFESQIFWMPIVLVRAAERSNRLDVLELFASERIPCDSYPWSVAQHELAAILARRSLKRPVPQERELNLQRAFSRLGATFFADLVPNSGNEPKVGKDPSAVSLLSRREREVARLVSDGLTNKEIAERLVLSERTVEGHVSNIFNKLNVGARSQVAVWYVANAASQTLKN